MCGRTIDQSPEELEFDSSGQSKAAALIIAQIALVKTMIHGRISDPFHRSASGRGSSAAVEVAGDMISNYALTGAIADLVRRAEFRGQGPPHYPVGPGNISGCRS